MSIQFYQYKACDSQGGIESGQISADSERDAIAILQGRKLVPVKIELTSKQNLTGNRKKIKNADLVDFTNGLCTLVEARVPIDKALFLLEGITDKEYMKSLVAALGREVKEGQSLAGAMELRPDVFSTLYVNIIRAGETGGILDQLLPDLAHHLETAEETKKQIISALTYPIILAITGILSVILLLVFVVPQFTAMFEEVGSKIPRSAEFLLNLSSGLKLYGWLVIPVIFMFVLAWQWLGQGVDRRRRRDAFLLSTPLLGVLLVYKDVAVFARTLGALLGANIPLLQSLRVAREVIANEHLRFLLLQAEEDVRSGNGLGWSLAKTGGFPILLHQLVAVGEESGRTGVILQKLAITFDTYVKDQMARLVSALQPAMILLLGVAVGGIIIVMLSAVFSMNAVEF